MQLFPIGKNLINTWGYFFYFANCEFNLPGDAMKSACGWSSGFRKDPMSMDGAGVGSGSWEKDIDCH